ncbi:MAG: DUF3854 domain-containing protein [Undibacterium sp.]|nr:DUF3854 domain-containing protein [Opitutaceae bacterium]
MLAEAGVRDVYARDALALIGFESPGLAIPYRTISGEPLVVGGRPFFRLRLLKPTRSAKYLSPARSGCQLYIPPRLRPLLAPGCILGVVEGEFKAIALVEAGFPCVAIGGITAGCPRNGSDEPELLPALAALIDEVRPSQLAFIGDSDTALIPDFSRKAVKIAKLAGVPVILPRIPLDAPGKGPDDLRELWGEEFPAKWQSLLDAAEPVNAETKRPALAVRLLRREAGGFAKLKPDALDRAHERLVTLAEVFSTEPLALAKIEEVAIEHARLPKASFRAAVAKIREAQSEAPATRTKSSRPFIILPGGDISITAAAEQIFGLIAKERTLFFRGGRVHEIATNADKSQRLDPVTPTQFRSIVETFGQVFVWRIGNDGEKVLKPALCPEETSKALLVSRPASELLPNVAQLSACPVLAKVGDEMQVLGPGWHALEGGLFVTGGDTPPRVPLSEAIQALSGLLRDFDFPSPGDRSRALASLVAPALRFGCWLKSPLPIDIGEADKSQSGKTYRQKVAAAIYRETCNVVVQRTGGVGGLDESISQKLIDGRPFILFDNLRGKLDTPFLESLLTAPATMPARVPHRGEVQVDPRSFVFQMTSNGVETTRDLANRSSLIRIRKQAAGFVFHAYPEGDLHTHVVANQSYYLGCVFSIVAEWVSKGQPRTTESRHDFREWAQTLDWISQNIFNAGPLLDGHEAARERVSDSRRIWLRAMCIALRDAKPAGELIASQLAEFAIENEIPPPNSGPNPDEATAARRIGIVMAAVFGDGDEVEIDGYKIGRTRRYNSTAGKEIPHYTFA